MSFWSGVVQGVKDIDVLKEKEALADERQGVRDEETARYNAATARQNRLEGLQATQYAAVEARSVEAHALAMTTGNLAISQTIANSVGGAAGAGGGPRGGSGSVPTAAEMNAGARALRARLDAVGGLDEMSTSDQAYYKPILANEAASFELNNLLEMAVGDNQDLTVLNAAERVRAVAIVAAQGQEAFAEFNRTSTAEGWNPESVLKAMELAKKVNPAFAELVLLTPSVDNLTQEEVYTTLESQMQLQAAVWAKVNGESPEFTTALNQLGDSNATIRSTGLTALVGMGVAQSWIHDNTKEGDLLRILSGPPVSAVPVAGGGGGGADVPTFSSEADILALPEAERLALVGTRVIIDGVRGTYVVETEGAPKPLSEPYKEYGESRQSGVGSELQAKYGEEFGQAGAQKVAETAWTVLQKTGEYMLKGADRAGGVALGSVNEVGSWLGVGLGFMNEAMGLDGTPMFQAAGELDDVAGQLFNGGISSADASQKLADMWRESLTREGGDVSSQMSESFGDYNGTIPTREEISTGSTPEGAAIKEAINALVNEVQQTTPTGRDLDADNLVGFDPGQTPNDDRFKSDEVIKGFMERNPRESVEAELGSTRSEGYRPTQMGATELNLPKFLEGLSEGTRKAVEAELGSTRSEGYRPTQMGATELNLPKFLEGLSEGTRKAVEAELAVMPKQEAPTVSLEDLSPDDLAELEAGVEEVISAIVGNADQGDIEVLVRGLNDKFTTDIVGVAMRMAMGS